MRKSLHTAILSLGLISGAVLLSSPVFAASTSTTSTVATTTSTPAAAPATAQSHAYPIITKLTQKLDLTQAQKDQIKTIVQTAKPQMDSLMQQLIANDRSMRVLMNAQDYDAKQIKKLADQKGDIISQMTVARAAMHHQIMQVLTPAQRTELAQLMEQQRAKFEARQ